MGVTVASDKITGYVWTENIGWINLSPTTAGVTNDVSGNLSGWAWGENVGWISFSCENTSSCGNVNYGVTIDFDGLFNGYAWGENIGWINFELVSQTDSVVLTSWGTGELDQDGDSIMKVYDNCPDTWNSEQLDADNDSIGDVCDNDPGCGGCSESACEKTLTEKIEELLTHYYENILGRAPDSSGLSYWTGQIMDIASSGGDIKEGFISFADNFFNSTEYLNRGRTDEEFVTDLYNTFFDRAPEPSGLAYWTDQLSQGVSRDTALNNFVLSTEFNNFMDEIFSVP